MRLSSSLALLALSLATPAAAEEMRQLGAHEHGRAVLNLAVDGGEIAMELIAPSADIVGFEHDAETDEDHATLEKALADLGDPLPLFGPSAEAGCAVSAAKAERVELEHHDDDEHEEHAHEEGEHEEHADEEHAHEEGEHEEHADEEHEHEEHAHEEHEHEEHGAEHSEIHAEYLLTCESPESIAALTLGYFDRFERAERLDVTVVSSKGQQRFETARGDASVDISGAL